MRGTNAAAQANREAGNAVIEQKLVWIESTDRETGLPVGIGLWNGDDTMIINVTDMFTGVPTNRTFYHRTVQDIGAIRYEDGLTIRPLTVTLVSNYGPVNNAVRAYEPRGAKVQIYKRTLSPTRQPLGVEGWYCGYVDDIDISDPEPDGIASVQLHLVSIAYSLTIASELKKSDEAQKKRLIPSGPLMGAPDGFRRYKGTTGTWDVPWGGSDE